MKIIFINIKEMAMGFKFRLTKNSKSRFISLEGKGRLILGIVAFIVVVTSAFRHAVLSKKRKDAEDADGKKGSDGKKSAAVDKKSAAVGADEKSGAGRDGKKEEGPIDKKTGLPHFIKRIIMPTA